MVRTMSPRLPVVLSVTLAAAMSALAAPAAHAITPTTLYAAPNGEPTGTCSHTDPCSLGHAMDLAATGDTIQVAPGSYGTKAAPLSASLSLTNTGVRIVDKPGARVPVIFSNALTGVTLTSGSTLTGMTINHSNGKAGLVLGATSAASHVEVSSTDSAAACAVEGGTLADSLCVNAGSGGTGVTTSAVSGTLDTVLRGVTAVNIGADGVGIDAFASFDGTDPGAIVTVQATNVIAEAATDVVATSEGVASASATVDLANSDYRTTGTTSKAGSATIHASGGDVSRAPRFVNAAKGNFHEKAGSPTINTGAKDPKGDSDLNGLPRTVGGRPDIGAYELHSAPALGKLRVRSLTKHTANLSIAVTPNGLATTVHFRATSGHAVLVSEPRSIGAAATTRTVHLTVSGLKPKGTYTVVVIATNSAGTTRSKPAHFKVGITAAKS
jgi:hypothetical protein